MKQFDQFITQLSEELKKPLPGKEGQLGMAPVPINQERFEFEHRDDALMSGVLILLYPDDGLVRFPIIQRNTYPGVHSGQISLPGGKKEATDIDLIDTAKREAQEEIGVPKDDVFVLGNLSEMYVQVSNFRILPTVGYSMTKPEFVQDDREVVKLFEVDLNDLLNPKIRQSKEMKAKQDLEMIIPYFNIQNKMVWGATAMILNEFSTILQRIK